jgi:ABC-type nitrate/sulfonate/bicarbonate transport system substrate-binding protein
VPIDRTRRKLLVGGALLAAGIAPGAARSQAPIATARIVSGAAVTEQSLPWIAAEAGVYSALGLNTQFLPAASGPSAALAELERSGAHLAYSGAAQVAERFLQGGDTVFIATVLEPNRGGMLMAVQAIRGPQELAGARVGVLSESGPSAASAQAVLERAGAAGASLVPLGTYEATYAALSEKRVDAAWLPVDLALKGRRAFGWNTFEGVRLALPGGYVTTRRAIAAQRGVVETLVEGLVAAIHYFKADAEGTAKLLARHLKVEPEVARDLQAFYAPLLKPAPTPGVYFGLRGLQQAFSARYPQATRMSADDLVERSFVGALVDSGAIVRLYRGPR